MNKAIKLADFWYKTDFDTFKNQFDGIEDAIRNARECIENDLQRTIEIIEQDIDEREDADFTKDALEIIAILTA